MRNNETLNQKDPIKEPTSFDDFPRLLAKHRQSKYPKETSLKSFVEYREDRKTEFVATFKPKSPSSPKEWRDYNFFEELYKKVPADERQRKRLGRLKVKFDPKITYYDARRQIADAENQLPPTPSVARKLREFGTSPEAFTRITAEQYLQEKEEEMLEKQRLQLIERFPGLQPSRDDLEQFLYLLDELKKQKLKYSPPSELSPDGFNDELLILDRMLFDDGDIPDLISDLKEDEEIVKKLTKTQLRAIFPDVLQLLRVKKSYDHVDILKIIEKRFPELIVEGREPYHLFADEEREHLPPPLRRVSQGEHLHEYKILARDSIPARGSTTEGPMALRKCKECGEQVSTKANKCPHCGSPLRPKTSGCAWAFLIGCVIWVGVAIFGSLDTSPSRTQSSSISTVSLAQTSAKENQKHEDPIAFVVASWGWDQEGDKITVEGALENISSRSVSEVSISIMLQNWIGKSIGTETAFIDAQPLEPKGTSFFVVSTTTKKRVKKVKLEFRAKEHDSIPWAATRAEIVFPIRP